MIKKLLFESWEWDFLADREHGIYLTFLHIPFYIAIVSSHALVRQQIWGFSGFLLFFITCSYLLWTFGYRKLYFYLILFSFFFLLCGLFSIFHADFVVYSLWFLLMYGGIKFSPVVFSHQNLRQSYHNKLWEQHYKMLNPQEFASLYEQLNEVKKINEQDSFYTGKLIWENIDFLQTLDKETKVPKNLIYQVYLMIHRSMKTKKPVKVSLSYAEGDKAKKTGNIRMDWEFDSQDAVFDGKLGIYYGDQKIRKYLENSATPAVLIKGFRNGKYVIRLGFFTQ